MAMTEKEELSAFKAIGFEVWELQLLKERGLLKKPKIRNIDDIPLPKLEKNIKRQISPKAIDRLFCEFWEIYPRKAAKQEAYKAFKSIKPTAETVRKICVAVHIFDGTEKQFIPYPATYLRGRRWEDVEAETIENDVILNSISIVPVFEKNEVEDE